MNDDERALAGLQIALLRALSEGTSVDDVRAHLREADVDGAHHAWIERFDPRAIEVAMAIAKRWIRVEGSPDVASPDVSRRRGR